jgi:hypothetical protein
MNSDYLAHYKIYPRISNINVDFGRRLVVVDLAAATSELVRLLGQLRCSRMGRRRRGYLPYRDG